MMECEQAHCLAQRSWRFCKDSKTPESSFLERKEHSFKGSGPVK